MSNVNQDDKAIENGSKAYQKEKFLMIGTVDASYVKELEEKSSIYDNYEELTGINIVHHVAQLLLENDSKVQENQD
ncbi:hypothetical protein Q4595_16045 [Wenyingzhuangia sp. 1_MG-2023]|nr:hypothetical protein [Wenyingzhuangia sp. 1_MG-2023]